MLDNVLIANIISVLQNGMNSLVGVLLAQDGSYILTQSGGYIYTQNSNQDSGQVLLSQILIQQDYQPTQEGTPSFPTIFLHKIGDFRLGFPARQSVWNAATQTESYIETQQYETTFQFSALVTQDPSNTSSLTAADCLNYAAYVLQSYAAITALEAQGIGVYRIGDVRNPYFSDDRGRYEASPSFDVTFTTKQIITLTTPIVTETVLQVLDV